MQNFNTDRVLRWRLILEEYGPGIYYIKGYNNRAAYALSRLPNNGNQETTHEQTYTTETMPDLYDIEELPEGTFPLSFNLIDRCQREDPFLTEKLKCKQFTRGSFRGGQNTIYLKTYKDKIVIRQKLQKYVVKWYHTYLLHPGLEQTEEMILQHLYWQGLKEAVHREATKCDTCQRTKLSIKK